MYPGNGGLGQFIQGAHQAGKGKGIHAVLGFAGAGHATHPVQVGPGGKRSAAAFHHHHAHGGIRACFLKRLGQRGNQSGVEGVVQ